MIREVVDNRSCPHQDQGLINDQGKYKGQGHGQGVDNGKDKGKRKGNVQGMKQQQRSDRDSRGGFMGWLDALLTLAIQHEDERRAKEVNPLVAFSIYYPSY